MSAKKTAGSEMIIIDGLDELIEGVESLSQAIRCAIVSEASDTDDPAEFMKGQLNVLFLAAGELHDVALELRCTADGAFCSK